MRPHSTHFNPILTTRTRRLALTSRSEVMRDAGAGRLVSASADASASRRVVVASSTRSRRRHYRPELDEGRTCRPDRGGTAEKPELDESMTRRLRTVREPGVGRLVPLAAGETLLLFSSEKRSLLPELDEGPRLRAARTFGATVRAAGDGRLHRVARARRGRACHGARRIVHSLV